MVGWLLILIITQADGHREPDALDECQRYAVMLSCAILWIALPLCQRFGVWNSLFLSSSTFNNCGFMTVPGLPIGTPGVPFLFGPHWALRLGQFAHSLMTVHALKTGPAVRLGVLSVLCLTGSVAAQPGFEH